VFASKVNSNNLELFKNEKYSFNSNSWKMELEISNKFSGKIFNEDIIKAINIVFKNEYKNIKYKFSGISDTNNLLKLIIITEDFMLVSDIKQCLEKEIKKIVENKDTFI
jgi:hypothetical protein